MTGADGIEVRCHTGQLGYWHEQRSLDHDVFAASLQLRGGHVGSPAPRGGHRFAGLTGLKQEVRWPC